MARTLSNFIVFAVLVIMPSIASSTAQIPDRIIIDKDIQPLLSNPLDHIFEANPDLLPDTSIRSSALWRGYVATFAIVDGYLYLKEFTMHGSRPSQGTRFPQESRLEDVFPGPSNRKLTWFSGFLVVPQGDRIRYEHQGYASVYESYLLISIENGSELERKRMSGVDYVAFRTQQFEMYQSTDRYQRHYQELIEASIENDYQMQESEIEQFLFIVDTWYPTFVKLPFPNK